MGRKSISRRDPERREETAGVSSLEFLGTTAGEVVALTLGPFQVFAGSGVNANSLALLNEGWDANLQTGLGGGRLLHVGNSGALEPRFSFGNQHVNGCRQSDINQLTVIELAADLHVGSQVQEIIADEILADKGLFVGFSVHEDHAGAVLVEIFHLPAVNENLLQLVHRTETAFVTFAALQVAQFGLNLGIALAGGQVGVAENHHNFAIDLQRRSLTDLGRVNLRHQLSPAVYDCLLTGEGFYKAT
jgi:hypothetical protein